MGREGTQLEWTLRKVPEKGLKPTQLSVAHLCLFPGLLPSHYHEAAGRPVLFLTISGLKGGCGVEGGPKKAAGVLAAHLSVVCPDLGTPELKTKTIPSLERRKPVQSL